MRKNTHQMLGRSEAFRGFVGDLDRVAGAQVAVLIEGENGVGTSLAARVLHAASPRSEGPLVEVDLAALSPSLIEAELFGHEEGAFTGAIRSRLGRFRRAQGGTLVLDGVECIPPELQVKLLRVLQERVVEPLGGEGPVEVDARVIATCGRDLMGEVEQGNFREDLYYRLAVVTLHLPPLRARPTDVPLLVEHLAGQIALRNRVPRRSFSPAALERLSAHPWPGNVRELENAIERVMVLVPAADSAGAEGAEPASPGTPALKEPGNPRVETDELDFLDEAVLGVGRRLAREALAHGIGLESFAAAMLEEALGEQRGNVSAAARRVGLSRRAFEYRLAKAKESAEPEEDGGGDRD